MNNGKNKKSAGRLRLKIKKKHILIAVIAVMAIIAMISVYFTVMRFVKVGDIEIIGIHPYDKDEIIDATGIKKGEYINSIDEKDIEERLMAEKQYLSSVSVEKKFPNKIVIELESRTPRWYIDIAGRKYALDSDLYVIEEIRNTADVTKLVLPSVTRAMSREVPSFGASETEVKRTLEIIQIVRTSSLRSRITELDVESRLNIRIVIDGKYEVLLGDVRDLEAKLSNVEELLDTEAVKNSVGGTFHAEYYPSTPISFQPKSKTG